MGSIFVVGTDTGVGKTVLSLLLMQLFHARGRRPFYLKPLQTGCRDGRDEESDAAFIYRHVAALQGRNPEESALYCFRSAKAPLFAARDEGRTIDVGFLLENVAERSRHADPLVLEAAGGLMVPVQDNVLMVDLVKATGAQVVVAARAGLGTINHTLLSLEALSARDMRPAGIVFLDAVGTPADMIAENKEAIERYSGLEVAGVIGPIPDFDRPPADCYRPLDSLLQGRPPR